ncbi:hypothetical protein [Sphingobium vermicomposti]|uniref:STAS/SEC14 domain-containing protein n=1 Tax=Sphingobium vermicomposti TaxID=529005 RepID=A0A846M4R6_9SPHN|nr:hypothetical protein [Sphingobium vermicomposti]NIJ15074.1 hypothetical protein [Sphingobium vermicomposti]
MSEDKFQIITGQRPKSVRIIFRGFWDDGTMQSYLAALRQHTATSADAVPFDKVLLDMRECTVQCQSVMEGFAKIVSKRTPHIIEYGILLPQSPLLKLQAKRLMQQTSSQFFEEEERAFQWLES